MNVDIWRREKEVRRLDRRLEEYCGKDKRLSIFYERYVVSLKYLFFPIIMEIISYIFPGVYLLPHQYLAIDT